MKIAHAACVMRIVFSLQLLVHGSTIHPSHPNRNDDQDPHVVHVHTRTRRTNHNHHNTNNTNNTTLPTGSDFLLQPRIIGGTEVPSSNDRYPWFVSMVTGSYHVCGGSLVTPEYVLTAAHCVGYFNGVRIGALCLDRNDNCGQDMETTYSIKIYPHPLFNENSPDNDVALVKLNTKSKITPVAMDQINPTPYDSTSKFWAVGLGDTDIDPNVYGRTNVLHHVELSHVERNVCKSVYGSNTISANMICASNPYKDTCQGDSGGPIFDKANNKVVGVVSFGHGCAVPGYPGVNARTSSNAHRKWIQKTICSDHSPPLPDFCTPKANAAPCPDPSSARIKLIVKSDKSSNANANANANASSKMFKVKRLNQKQRRWKKTVFLAKGLKKKFTSVSKCVPRNKCYKMVALDSEGSGLGDGFYKLIWDNQVVVEGNFDNGNRNVSPTFGDRCE